MRAWDNSRNSKEVYYNIVKHTSARVLYFSLLGLPLTLCYRRAGCVDLSLLSNRGGVYCASRAPKIFGKPSLSESTSRSLPCLHVLQNPIITAHVLFFIFTVAKQHAHLLFSSRVTRIAYHTKDRQRSMAFSRGVL